MSTESATNPAEGEALPEDEVAPDGADQDGDAGEGQDGEGDSPDEEAEELEFDGHKLSVPKAVATVLKDLKEGGLRQADYTQKTQALAAERTTLAEDRKAHVEHVALQTELLDKKAELKVIDKDLKLYSTMTQDEWNELFSSNKATADQHWRNFQILEKAKAALEGEVKAGETKALDSQKALSSKAVEQGLATLQKDIPDFTPAYFGKLVAFGGQFGIADHEVRSALADPRQIKILNRLYVAEEALAKARKTGVIERTAAIRPAVRLGGAAPATKDPNRMSTDAWMADRRAHLAKKGGRR